MDETLAMESIQDVIKKFLSRFLQRNPQMDREELLGEAQIIALKAVRTHIAGKSNLRSRVWTCLSHRIISNMRNPAWRRRMCKKDGSELFDQPGKEPFDLQSLLLQVSDECRQAVELALNSGMKKTALSKTLYQDLHWERSLIMQVFAEVRECL